MLRLHALLLTTPSTPRFALATHRGAKGPAAGKTKEAKMKAATAKKGIKKKVRACAQCDAMCCASNLASHTT
jgi:hypothetical protein